MTPTYAGRVYLSAAREMVRLKKETYKIILDSTEENSGEIAISYTPERGSLAFSNAYIQFHKEYPKFTFKTMEARGLQQEQLLLHRDVDFAFMAYSEATPIDVSLATIDQANEYMVLGLPKSHPLAYLAGEESWNTLPYIDIRRLRDDAFILCSNETMMRRMINHVFSANGIEPKILFEASSSHTIVQMACNQFGPAFFPQSYVSPDLPLVFFRTNPSQNWMRCCAYRKGTYISKPERRFIELMTEAIIQTKNMNHVNVV